VIDTAEAASGMGVRRPGRWSPGERKYRTGIRLHRGPGGLHSGADGRIGVSSAASSSAAVIGYPEAPVQSDREERGASSRSGLTDVAGMQERSIGSMWPNRLRDELNDAGIEAWVAGHVSTHILVTALRSDKDWKRRTPHRSPTADGRAPRALRLSRGGPESRPGSIAARETKEASTSPSRFSTPFPQRDRRGRHPDSRVLPTLASVERAEHHRREQVRRPLPEARARAAAVPQRPRRAFTAHT